MVLPGYQEKRLYQEKWLYQSTKRKISLPGYQEKRLYQSTWRKGFTREKRFDHSTKRKDFTREKRLYQSTKRKGFPRSKRIYHSTRRKGFTTVPRKKALPQHQAKRFYQSTKRKGLSWAAREKPNSLSQILHCISVVETDCPEQRSTPTPLMLVINSLGQNTLVPTSWAPGWPCCQFECKTDVASGLWTYKVAVSVSQYSQHVF